ncbi:MAG TPA: hypothetical protein VGQ44_14805 [Gemmatimonadaceae bacterium]|jgi:hypothetical protein|nr:hypothetical protein [Gemmatimonadaceae bacterium]
MRLRFFFLAATALGACTHHVVSAPAASVRFGVYRFAEHPDGMKDPIQGRVLVKEDTVVVEVESRSCRYFPQSTRLDVFVYDCGDVGLSFNRLQPVAGAQFSTHKTVLDRSVSCIRYTTDRSGNQVCTQQHTENVERQVPVSGKLHLAYVANP